MTKKYWLFSLLIGVVFGLIVACVFTIMDWRLNPGGIFHGDHGTDWAIVSETFVSWFFPVAAAASLLAVVVFFLLLLARRVRGPS